MRSVAVAGHLCLDLTPGLPGATTMEPGRLFEVGSLAMKLGGCVANTGGDLADLGLNVRFITAVGDDDLGSFVRAKIAAQAGVSADLRVVRGTSTSYSLVFEPPHTDRTFWHHVGANAFFDGTEVDDLTETDLLHLGYPPLLPALLTDQGRPLVDLLSRTRAAGVTTSIDLAVVDPESPTTLGAAAESGSGAGAGGVGASGGALSWAQRMRSPTRAPQAASVPARSSSAPNAWRT